MIYDPVEFVIFIHSMNNMGGTEIAAVRLAEGLKSIGVKVIILALKPYSGVLTNVTSLGEYIYNEYEALTKPFNTLLSPQKGYNYLKRKLEDFCNEKKPRLFINFSYGLFPANPSNVKTAAVIHWSINGYEESIRGLIRRKSIILRFLSAYIFQKQCYLNHRALESMDYVVALTQAGKEEIKSINNRLDSNKIKIIPNFVKKIALTDRISNQNNHRIFFVGRLSVEKGCYRLLDIWEKICGSISDWSLEIYGNGQEEERMKQIIYDRNLQNINFHGFVRDMNNHYPSGDILLCTSDSEGFGLVIIEAMQFGVVPVTFDCPVSPKEIIADGGECVKCFDIDSFAEKVIKLCKDRDKRIAIQQKAVARSKCFLEEDIIKLWTNLI